MSCSLNNNVKEDAKKAKYSNDSLYALCFEFYNLNKDKKDCLNNLLGIQIGGVRDVYEWDSSMKKQSFWAPFIFIRVSDSTIMRLPTFPPNAENDIKAIVTKRLTRKDSLYLSEKYNIEIDSNYIIEAYYKEVESIYDKYYCIKIPQESEYINIPIQGYLNYIDFQLLHKRVDKKMVICSCYYIKNPSKFNIPIDGLCKFDSHWYYRFNVFDVE